jgi:hypothetical protein
VPTLFTVPSIKIAINYGLKCGIFIKPHLK